MPLCQVYFFVDHYFLRMVIVPAKSILQYRESPSIHTCTLLYYFSIMSLPSTLVLQR